MPSEKAKTKTLAFARTSAYPITAGDCYVAPHYSAGQTLLPAEPIKADKRERLPYIFDFPSSISHLATLSPGIADPNLVSIIEQRKPKHIIIGIGGGMQDKLGSYLKHQLTYRPGIYCIGAAPGFVTGDQVTIPMWADRFFFGWIFRIAAQPRTYLARYWKARIVAFLIKEYGREMPPLQQRFNDG